MSARKTLCNTLGLLAVSALAGAMLCSCMGRSADAPPAGSDVAGVQANYGFRGGVAGSPAGHQPTAAMVDSLNLGVPLVLEETRGLHSITSLSGAFVGDGQPPTETWYVATDDRTRSALGRRKAGESFRLHDQEAAGEPVELPEPTCGTLVCIGPGTPGKQQYVTVPLEHTQVAAAIDGFIGRTRVTQTFTNPYDGKIEAVYVFPLPQDAAVTDFIMTVGDRTIRGIIREREEAKRLYEEARAQGHVASLLQQERPNIFLQKVANIEPGKVIDIDITYFGTMPYRNGGFEYVFPMVVGPRFNPEGTPDPIVPLPEGGAQYATSGTPVTYLSPEQRSGHDIGLTVELDAGVSIEDIASPTHAVKITRASEHVATVALSSMDSIPNRDFVLRWTVAGDALKTAMLTHEDDRGGFFTLMMVPPAQLKQLDRAPMEMIFVLDCSGSMDGEPLEIARAAVKRALRRMQPGDTFQIIRFARNATQMSPQPIAATPGNVDAGIRYLDGLSAGGGTYMINGIKAALGFDHDATHVRSVVFMTDGYIGNEADILGEIGRNLGDARIFSFGIGSSPNRYLLQRMADIGNGTCSFIGLDASRIDAMDEYFDLVSHPAMHDVAIDFGDGTLHEVFPSNMPDLFVGRPVYVTGRYEGDFDGNVSIAGRVGTTPVRVTCDRVERDDRPALAQVWARSLIKDLNDRSTWEPSGDHADRILHTALAYNLASSFTSFVAVDSSVITEGDHGTTVHVPVPVPEGVQYDTTVGTPRGHDG